ncbi:MAG TPA: sugar phosphate isomerase/epimerase family protein [Gemmatimonadaceae bacterium]|nr:sugar phosphate isomerase/epimerase family protein [Gemmatimonadaceae bacterium]
MFASFNPGQIGLSALALREGLALAERHGFGGFDPSLVQLHDEVTRHGAAAVRGWFVGHGLQMGAWTLPFMPWHVPEAEWQDWLARLPALAASAAAVGALRAAIWTFPGSNDFAYEENFRHYVRRFQPVARVLGAHGIRLGLEAVGPETAQRQYRHPFLRKPAEAWRLAQAIAPNCGVVLDSYHWHCAGGTRAELAALPAASIVQAHVCDGRAGRTLAQQMDLERRLPGESGVVDLDGFMSALAAHRFDGPVTAEPFDDDVNALGVEGATARTARATRAAVARAVLSAPLSTQP